MSWQRWGSEKEKLWWGQWSTDAAPNAEDTFFFAMMLVPSYWKTIDESRWVSQYHLL
jgi:hypothetical protein